MRLGRARYLLTQGAERVLVAVAANWDFRRVGCMRNSDAQILVILITVPSRREAVRIGQAIVKKKLAACANILSPVTSIFRWKGRIEKSREALLIVKTTGRRYAALAKLIGSIHPYEVPEIIALKVTKGLPRYIAWVQRETAID